MITPHTPQSLWVIAQVVVVVVSCGEIDGNRGYFILACIGGFSEKIGYFKGRSSAFLVSIVKILLL